jgi:hypothetical protein
LLETSASASEKKGPPRFAPEGGLAAALWAHEHASRVMLSTRFVDTPHSGDKRAAQHGVIQRAGLVMRAQVCGGKGVDGYGWHVIRYAI